MTRLCLFVCLSVRSHISIAKVQISPHFLYLLPVAVARSSSDGSAICSVLPVYRMTSCFTITKREWAESETTRMLRRVCQVAASGAKSAVSDCILLLARLMGQYCVARWRQSSSVVVVVCNAAGRQARAGRRARGRSGGRHCTAGQYGYVPLRRHLIHLEIWA